ncbi:YesL family protein [Gracilibacillus sp. D59]|uniref:YesL family protein n=1 Tax=Gracilibacillus sp. D59 TaxID=3457434 RepID=UPI003FCD5630
MERVYYLAEFVLRVVYLNILVIVFSLLGLIFFGFFPAMTAAFYIVRKWLTGYSDIKITKHFYKVFKKEFFKSNGVGLLLTMIGLLLYINLTIADMINHSLVHLSYFPILTVFVLFLCLSLFVIPIYIHFRSSLLSVIKHAFLLLFVDPLNTLLLLITVSIFCMIMKTIPGFIPVCGLSGLALIVMHFSLKTFEKVTIIQGIERKEVTL